MLEHILTLITVAAALGAGLIAGTFFAFSTFVMRALGRLPAAEGMAAMQSINLVVINPWFLGVFLATAAACVALLAAAALRWQAAGAGYLMLGAGLYLVGTVLVTIACNVPLNTALAGVAPGAPEAARLWSEYLASWTPWNHVRTVAALSAAAAFTQALRQ
ncbi:MAG: anthrone oxygenase family protein [Deltaproteobacteria bacterium]|nr:anthrone oxygenase family protein [Deltaproteobacteria bacterium]